jgi:hypothetical protein
MFSPESGQMQSFGRSFFLPGFATARACTLVEVSHSPPSIATSIQ